jgi:hypothetical protein
VGDVAESTVLSSLIRRKRGKRRANPRPPIPPLAYAAMWTGLAVSSAPRISQTCNTHTQTHTHNHSLSHTHTPHTHTTHTHTTHTQHTITLSHTHTPHKHTTHTHINTRAHTHIKHTPMRAHTRKYMNSNMQGKQMKEQGKQMQERVKQRKEQAHQRRTSFQLNRTLRYPPTYTYVVV